MTSCPLPPHTGQLRCLLLNAGRATCFALDHYLRYNGLLCPRICISRPPPISRCCSRRINPTTPCPLPPHTGQPGAGGHHHLAVLQAVQRHVCPRGGADGGHGGDVDRQRGEPRGDGGGEGRQRRGIRATQVLAGGGKQGVSGGCWGERVTRAQRVCCMLLGAVSPAQRGGGLAAKPGGAERGALRSNAYASWVTVGRGLP